MAVSSGKITSSEATAAIVGLLAAFVVGWLVSGALRVDPPRDHHLVIETQGRQASLEQASRKEWAILRAERAAETSGGASRKPLPYAILGDGIAGAAAAVNFGASVRVFGSRSFWADLHGVAEIWQTGNSLKDPFENAGLKDPRSFDSGAQTDRLLWLAVENSRLEALHKPGIHYLHSGCEFSMTLIPATSADPGRWRISSCSGEFEDIAGPVIVATGASSARTILSLMPRTPPAPPAPLADSATRLELLRKDLLMSGDDYLAQSRPAVVDTLVVLGSGGNAADVARHALAEKAAKTVVLIGPKDAVESTPAYGKLRSEHGDRICRTTVAAATVAYVNNQVRINGSDQLECETLNGDRKTGVRIHLVVESLGRVAGDLPRVLRSVQVSSPGFKAIPVRDSTARNALVGVRLDFAAIPYPVLLTGAAADLAETMFDSTTLGELGDGRRKLAEEINPEFKADSSKPQENPRVGFAAAAFMGSRLAKKCFAPAPAGPASFNDAGCR